MPPKAKAYSKALSVKSGTNIDDKIKKCRFVIKSEIGSGGFGRIYDGHQIGTSGTKSAVAIKVEPAGNGPLFTEMHVYMKILKIEQFEAWKKEQGVKYLGLPHIISSGRFEYEGNDLRYLVIPKFSVSLESLLTKEGSFELSKVLKLSHCLLHSLAYMHDKGYSHGDVKAGNIMFNKPDDFAHAYLIDFGLAKMLSPNDLTEKVDKKRAHNGTPHFTSCDAHRGCAPSFRGDLEILTHNMLFWLTGSLPWEKYGDDCEKIFKTKQKLIENVDRLLPKMLDDPKSIALISKFYKTSKDMAFDSKMDVAQLLKI